MKKVLSIILALIMAFTIALPAFATNEQQVELGNRTNISVRNEVKDVVFTPSKDGFYMLTVDGVGGNLDDVSYMLSFNNTETWNEKEEIWEYRFVGEEGKSAVATFDAGNAGYTVSVLFEEVLFETLNEGKNSVKIGPEERFFKFVPEKSGYYNFASECSEVVAFEILDADELNDFNMGNGYEAGFDWTVKLEAGKVYVAGISSEKEINCDVIVTCGKTEKVDKLYLNGRHWMSKDSIESIDLYFAPTGSITTADIKITSSDESIVSVGEFDRKFCDVVIGSHNKPGKAVITVTADGVTETYKVKVCNDFEYSIVYFLRELQYNIARIEYFFRELFSGFYR